MKIRILIFFGLMPENGTVACFTNVFSIAIQILQVDGKFIVV